MALSGKVGAVYRTDGSSITFTDEATTSNAEYTRYTITNTTKRYWDDTVAVTVKKNGVTITTGFTIEYSGGVVVFDTPLLNTDVILVSCKYFTLAQCATFFNWKLDIDLETKDVTTFASDGWKENIVANIGWTANSEGYWADETFLALLGERIVVIFYVDSVTSKRYEGYVVLKKNGIDTPVDDVVKESVDFEGTGKLFYRE